MTTGILSGPAEVRWVTRPTQPRSARFQRTSGPRTSGGRPAHAPSYSDGRAQSQKQLPALSYQQSAEY